LQFVRNINSQKTCQDFWDGVLVDNVITVLCQITMIDSSCSFFRFLLLLIAVWYC